MTDYEKVNHPEHYNKHPSGVECIDIIRWYPFNVGVAMKHLWRAGLKPGESAVEDLKKAIWYLQDEVERLEALPVVGEAEHVQKQTKNGFNCTRY